MSTIVTYFLSYGEGKSRKFFGGKMVKNIKKDCIQKDKTQTVGSKAYTQGDVYSKTIISLMGCRESEFHFPWNKEIIVGYN